MNFSRKYIGSVFFFFVLIFLVTLYKLSQDIDQVPPCWQYQCSGRYQSSCSMDGFDSSSDFNFFPLHSPSPWKPFQVHQLQLLLHSTIMLHSFLVLWQVFFSLIYLFYLSIYQFYLFIHHYR